MMMMMVMMMKITPPRTNFLFYKTSTNRDLPLLFREEIQTHPILRDIERGREREGFDISGYAEFPYDVERAVILLDFPNISNGISNLSYFAFASLLNLALIFCLYETCGMII